MYFEQLDLNENVLDALYDMHFDECTPVQEKCIPQILEGHDVLGVAQTGTGKTAAYLLPILSKLGSGDYPKDSINCVIMSPTRELAQQIDQAFQGFGYYLNDISSVAVYGGNDGNRFDQETKGLRMGTDVVIATPGRFISHINIGNVDLSKTSFFVLDEADRMLDMGFMDDILTIAKLLPKTCQVIMFSATMPAKIEDLAKSLLKSPVVIKLAVSKPAEKIKQRAYLCYEPQKIAIIKWLFKNDELKRVIIFCGKKTKVKEVSRALNKAKISVGEMHSDLTQAERDDIMFRFKSGQIDVLVATDIVARGIDIDDIAMVVNYDVPHDVEDYVHRIGRTARADRDGVAITFVSDQDIPTFKAVEKFLEKDIDKLPLPNGMESPEYKVTKTKVKAIRRKDRDKNAHKRKPRKNQENKTTQENTVAKAKETYVTNGEKHQDAKANRRGKRTRDGKVVEKQEQRVNEDNKKRNPNSTHHKGYNRNYHDANKNNGTKVNAKKIVSVQTSIKNNNTENKEVSPLKRLLGKTKKWLGAFVKK